MGIKEIFVDVKNKLELLGFFIEETELKVYSEKVLQRSEHLNLLIRVSKFGKAHIFTLFKEDNYIASDIATNQSGEDPVLTILGFLARKIDLENYYLGGR